MHVISASFQTCSENLKCLYADLNSLRVNLSLVSRARCVRSVVASCLRDCLQQSTINGFHLIRLLRHRFSAAGHAVQSTTAKCCRVRGRAQYRAPWIWRPETASREAGRSIRKGKGRRSEGFETRRPLAIGLRMRKAPYCSENAQDLELCTCDAFELATQSSYSNEAQKSVFLNDVGSIFLASKSWGQPKRACSARCLCSTVHDFDRLLESQVDTLLVSEDRERLSFLDSKNGKRLSRKQKTAVVDLHLLVALQAGYGEVSVTSSREFVDC